MIDNNNPILLIQPVDSHDITELPTELDFIKQHSKAPFVHIPVRIDHWNEQLTPWPAPPVFGKIPFGSGAKDTLELINTEILPKHPHSKVIIGGYSLAGLFALWTGWQQVVDGIVAASPSVWYKDWLDYAANNPCKAKHVYLSLGDKEYHSKNKLMATVGECINKQKDILTQQGVDCTLEMNPGNHFQDNGVRTAKGFAWCIDKIMQEECK